MTDIQATPWLNQMENDGVLEDMIQTRRVSFSAQDRRIKQAKDDLIKILPSMKSSDVNSAMNRTACDDVIHGCCPFQQFCWSPVEVSLDDLGHLYKRKS